MLVLLTTKSYMTFKVFAMAFMDNTKGGSSTYWALTLPHSASNSTQATSFVAWRIPLTISRSLAIRALFVAWASWAIRASWAFLGSSIHFKSLIGFFGMLTPFEFSPSSSFNFEESKVDPSLGIVLGGFPLGRLLFC